MADERVFGLHAVAALLESSPEACRSLLVQSGLRGKVDAILSLAQDAGVRVERADKRELDRLSADANHQGVIARVDRQLTFSEGDLDALLARSSGTPLILALDGIQDPHNLGACLRTAEAFGVDVVIAPKDKACGITPVVRKVASGAAERIPFVPVVNLARTLQSLKKSGLWVFGAAGEAGDPLHGADLSVPAVILMGAEGRGLRQRSRSLCDHLLAIPMHGDVGSFNVSVACGIFLYEVIRQRGTP